MDNSNVLGTYLNVCISRAILFESVWLHFFARLEPYEHFVKCLVKYVIINQLGNKVS